MNTNKLVLTSNEAKAVEEALEYWTKSCQLLTCQQHEQLTNSFSIIETNWSFLIRCAFWCAIACFVIAAATLISDAWLLRFLRQFIEPTKLKSSIFFMCLAIGFYQTAHFGAWSFFMHEAFLLLFVATLDGSFYLLKQHFTSQNKNFSGQSLAFIEFGIYAVIATYEQSHAVWVASLVVLGIWSIETCIQNAIISEPIAGLILGIFLCCVPLQNVSHLSIFVRTTRITGVVFTNLALLILSFLGRQTVWERPSKMEGIFWSVIWLAYGFGLAAHGTYYHDSVTRGLALAFGIINLYGKYFEHFWGTTHKAIFFSVMGISFWFLGYQLDSYNFMG